MLVSTTWFDDTVWLPEPGTTNLQALELGKAGGGCGRGTQIL